VSPPLVTVGVPFFNAERWLADGIKSVFAQRFSDWELILMDDGSMDGGLQFARSICDSRVRVYSDGRNLKVTARRNEIVQLARGTYFAWLDADDMMHPERLRKQVEFLESNPSVDVVSTGMFILDRSGRVVAKRLVWAGTRPTCKASESPFVQGTAMGRTEWFRQNPQDPGLERVADMELWLRTAPYTRFAKLDHLLTFYTEFESFSPQKYRLGHRCTRQVLRRHGPRVAGKWNAHKEILKSYLKPLVFGLAYYCGLHRQLLRRRSLPVMPDERMAAEAILEKIRQQDLPLKREHAITPGPA